MKAKSSEIKVKHMVEKALFHPKRRPWRFGVRHRDKIIILQYITLL
jgi:hypothetical protein